MRRPPPVTLDAVVGRRYGPIAVAATPDGVGAYVAATGDDPLRWTDHAPPGYASVALFAVAPRFLADPDVVPFTRSLIHSEQTFAWQGPLAIGSIVTVAGEVTGVRSRGPLNVVSFAVTARCGDEPWLTSASSFLMSAGEAGSAQPEPEPPHDHRGLVDPVVAGPLPVAGAPLPTVRRSASRGDLLRYAAATGDWNPIHWDHDAAVAAGLSGVVVHGLLMAAWVAQSAAAVAPPVPRPLDSLRIRFRKPLRPGDSATVAGTVTAVDDTAAELALSVAAEAGTLVSATARVTP